MTFDPKESIDFNGNTGPFIQYTYARIQSILRKSANQERSDIGISLNNKEVLLMRLLYEYPDIISDSANTLNPSLIANFLYELAKEFNQFYHDFSILGADTKESISFRLHLAQAIGNVINSGMGLLGIEVPERM